MLTRLPILLGKLGDELLVLEDLLIDCGRSGIGGCVGTGLICVWIQFLGFLERLKSLGLVTRQIRQESLVNPMASIFWRPTNQLVRKNHSILKLALLHHGST